MLCRCPQKNLPCQSWLRDKLRDLVPALLQALLNATVRDLNAEIPGLGEVVAFDVKHIYAWVKENNPRIYFPRTSCERINSQAKERSNDKGR